MRRSLAWIVDATSNQGKESAMKELDFEKAREETLIEAWKLEVLAAESRKAGNPHGADVLDKRANEKLKIARYFARKAKAA